jgi:hypothetical protein
MPGQKSQGLSDRSGRVMIRFVHGDPTMNHPISLSLMLALALLPACQGSGSSGGDDDSGTGADSDSETDTDIDTETETESDTLVYEECESNPDLPPGLWAAHIGGPGTERSRDAAVAPDGSVFVVGEYEDQISVTSCHHL